MSESESLTTNKEAREITVNQDRLEDIAGTKNKPAFTALGIQVCEAFPERLGNSNFSVMDMAMALLGELKPQDTLEGMLCSQMVALHGLAMDCVRCASYKNQSLESFDMHARHAARLMNAFTNAVTALDKHRGKGQTITVKHQQVNVEAGAQAVIGDVNHGGGGKKKNE